MSIIETEDELQASVADALITISNTQEGLTITSEESLPINIIVDETVIAIESAMVEIESSEVSITADEAMEVEVGADFDLSVGGAIEMESGDVDIDAAAVEVEAALFTVE